MARNGGGVYSKPVGTNAVSGEVIASASYNLLMDDIAADLNTARPITAGGTGATSATGARSNLGLAIGSDIQEYGANLQGIKNLGNITADKYIYTTATNTFAEGTISAKGRQLVNDADAATMRTTLGLADGATTDIATLTATLTASWEGYTDTQIAAISGYLLADPTTSTSTAMVAGAGVKTFSPAEGLRPFIRMFWRCDTASEGYGVGDVLPVATDEGDGGRGVAVVIKADGDVEYRQGATPYIIHGSTNVKTLMTAANWSIVLEAQEGSL